jgi:hypothetical protein
MDYTIEFTNVERERDGEHHKASIVYSFVISNGFIKTHGNVVLTEAGAGVIEQAGKDAQTAAEAALKKLLSEGRDPFETQILLQVPYGHAEYFAKHGNYGTLALSD